MGKRHKLRTGFSLLPLLSILLLSSCDIYENPDIFFSPYKFNKSCLSGDYLSNTWRGHEKLTVHSDGTFTWHFTSRDGEEMEHEGTWQIYGDEETATNVGFEDVMFAGFREDEEPWISDNWNPNGVPTLFRRIKLMVDEQGYHFLSKHKCTSE